MPVRIVTADERLSAAQNKTSIAIFGPPGRQDLAAEDAAAGQDRLSRPGGGHEVGAGLARCQHPDPQLRRFPRSRGADRWPRSGCGPKSWYSAQHHRMRAGVYAGSGIEEFLATKSIIFVDWITDLTRQAMVYARQQPEAFSERTGKPDIRGAYGLLGREVIQALKHLQHAPGKTVIFVGVLEKVTDEFNAVTWQPQMEGTKAGRELPGIVDQVISMHLFARDAEGDYLLDEKAAERRLVCRAGNPYGLPAKDRCGRLDMTEPPDLGALLAKINTPVPPRSRPQPDPQQKEDTHVRSQRRPAADGAHRRTHPRWHLCQGRDDHPPRRCERRRPRWTRDCSRPRSRAMPRCWTASSRWWRGPMPGASSGRISPSRAASSTKKVSRRAGTSPRAPSARWSTARWA